jgi:hypothetical protein
MGTAPFPQRAFHGRGARASDCGRERREPVAAERCAWNVGARGPIMQGVGDVFRSGVSPPIERRAWAAPRRLACTCSGQIQSTGSAPPASEGGRRVVGLLRPSVDRGVAAAAPRRFLRRNGGVSTRLLRLSPANGRRKPGDRRRLPDQTSPDRGSGLMKDAIEIPESLLLMGDRQVPDHDEVAPHPHRRGTRHRRLRTLEFVPSQPHMVCPETTLSQVLWWCATAA